MTTPELREAAAFCRTGKGSGLVWVLELTDVRRSAVGARAPMIGPEQWRGGPATVVSDGERWRSACRSATPGLACSGKADGNIEVPYEGREERGAH